MFPQGFAKAMSGFVKLGLIDVDPCPLLAVDAPVVSWVSNYSYYTFFLHVNASGHIIAFVKAYV